MFGHQAPDQPSTPATNAAPPESATNDASKPAASAVDPMQWWSALTQQFQTIAADALKEVAQSASKAPLADASAPDADDAPGANPMTSMAEKAAAALAAGSQAVADNASKTLVSSAALMTKALKNSAWPMPVAAVAGTPAAAKKAAVPAAKKPAAPSRVATKKSGS